MRIAHLFRHQSIEYRKEIVSRNWRQPLFLGTGFEGLNENSNRWRKTVAADTFSSKWCKEQQWMNILWKNFTKVLKVKIIPLQSWCCLLFTKNEDLWEWKVITHTQTHRHRQTHTHGRHESDQNHFTCSWTIKKANYISDVYEKTCKYFNSERNKHISGKTENRKESNDA